MESEQWCREGMELKEQIRVLRERWIKAEESKSSKDKVISLLNKELNDLVGKNMENNQILMRGERMALMIKEVERLESEKLAANKVLNEMKQRLSEANGALNEMKQKLSEADEASEQLRNFKIEVEKLMRERDLSEEKRRLVEVRSREEVERLKIEKLAADEALNEMKQRLSEAYQTMECLRNFEFEREKLMRERDLSVEKCRLAELRNREAESEKLKFLQDLQKRNRRDRRKMELRIRVLRERLMRADKMRSQIISEKNQVISELKGRIMDNDLAVKRVVQMEREDERLSDEETLYEMKQKLSKSKKTVKQPRNLNSEFSKAIKDLRWHPSSLEDEKLSDEDTLYEMKRKIYKTYRTVKKLMNLNPQFSKTMKDLRRGTCGTTEEMRGGQVIDHQIIEELRGKLLAADQTIQELRRLNSEASNTIDQLIQRLLIFDDTVKQMRFRQAKADKTLEDLRRRSSEGLTGLLKSYAAVLDNDLRCSGDGNQRLENVGSENSSSPAATREEVSNNKNTESLSQAGRQSECPLKAENSYIGREKEREMVLMSGSKTMHSPCSLNKKDANDVNAGTSSRAGKHSDYTPQADIEGKGQKKIVLLPGGVIYLN